MARLFLSYIFCNIGSHGQAQESLSVLITLLVCIPRDFLAGDFISQWDPNRAGKSPLKCGASGTTVEVEEGRTKGLDPYLLRLYVPLLSGKEGKEVFRK